jgi:thiamine biosynthesis lipoprotein
MSAIGAAPRAGQAWSQIGVASSEVAVADRDALGTTARMVIWPAQNLIKVLAVVDRELDMLDRQASRFRGDSEVSRLYSAGAGSYVISDGLAEAVGIALAAARWTDGLSDPTVGTSLISLGYDRDFTRIEPGALATPSSRDRPPGWLAVRLDENVLTVPDRLMLDLGATAKGLGADRAARAAYAAAGGGGVLVSLGGDMAVAGRPPVGGWPVLVADEHRQTRAARNIAAGGQRLAQDGRASGARPSPEIDPAVAQQIRLSRGGLATSSVTCRRWLRGGTALHHIIDPRTGMPASGPWRTVSVVAASCAEANAASTAAIVAGDEARDWLTAQGLPARLIGHDGLVRHTGGWPEEDDRRVDPPQSRLALYLNRRTQ